MRSNSFVSNNIPLNPRKDFGLLSKNESSKSLKKLDNRPQIFTRFDKTQTDFGTPLRTP